MGAWTNRIQKSKSDLKLALLDDSKRIRLQFTWIYCALMTVSFFMTVVNIVTGKKLLMFSTLAFGILCFANVILARRSEKALLVSGWIFSVEMLALLTFFVVSGTPEGFSAIWACLLPASGLLLFRRKRGTALCAVMFLILLFFFETPIGNSFLRYPYTTSFKLRFPMLYIAFFAVSFLLETIRSITFDEMKRAQNQYQFLYRHDALTGVLNRYGFNERLDHLLSAAANSTVSLVILDLDNFKRINDTYGHPFGDVVLRAVADILVKQVGPDADVCRWGGEEFGVLLGENRDAVQCGWELVEAIRALSVQTANASVGITVSVGVATAQFCEGLNAAAIVHAADRCLYAAKENGRNTLVHTAISSGSEEQAELCGMAEMAK